MLKKILNIQRTEQATYGRTSIKTLTEFEINDNNEQLCLPRPTLIISRENRGENHAEIEREGGREGARGYKHPPLSFDFVGVFVFLAERGKPGKEEENEVKCFVCERETIGEW